MPLPPAVVNAARESAIGKLLAFAFQPAFDSDHTTAERLFWGDRLADTSTPEFQWLMESEDATIKYNSWFLFDWEPDATGTVTDFFLQNESERLSPAERHLLTRLARAHLRLYEVEAVDRLHGLHVVDLWNGERRFVTERTASRQIVRWDLLGARVAPDGFDGFVLEGGLYLYPAAVKDQILGRFRRLHRRHHKKFPLDDSASFFRKHSVVFHHLWLDLVAFPAAPRVTTAEGHLLIFCSVIFDCAHVEEVRAALRRQPVIHPGDGGTLSWRESTASGEREIGVWTFEGQRVVFETTSKERAEHGRTWIEQLVGDLVRYRATGLETVDQAIEALRQPPRLRAPDEPAELGTVAVRELYDRHYRAWLDRPLAVLGNRTPRIAARTRLWRTRLLDLLKRLENESDRAALAGRHPYDFSWIWRELGLERPVA